MEYGCTECRADLKILLHPDMEDDLRDQELAERDALLHMKKQNSDEIACQECWDFYQQELALRGR